MINPNSMPGIHLNGELLDDEGLPVELGELAVELSDARVVLFEEVGDGVVIHPDEAERDFTTFDERCYREQGISARNDDIGGHNTAWDVAAFDRID